jgi:phosphoketolase
MSPLGPSLSNRLPKNPGLFVLPAPSHASPECPGSIHEGGELGYSLSHSFGAVFDNPDLVVACVVGDGEAETGPLATAWHSNKFLNPASDGAVLPILHLNGYKISNPTLLARITREELEQLLRGYGWTPYFVEGHEPGLAPRLPVSGCSITSGVSNASPKRMKPRLAKLSTLIATKVFRIPMRPVSP